MDNANEVSAVLQGALREREARVRHRLLQVMDETAVSEKEASFFFLNGGVMYQVTVKEMF